MALLSAGEPATSSPTLLGPLNGPAADGMRQVREMIRRVLHHEDPKVDEVLRHAGLLGGKGLRPALLLLAGEACGQVTARHVTAGAVLELLHVATLIHDDVLDGAQQRRHVATIGSRWNERTAILAGDLLLAKAYSLAATTGSTLVCQRVADAAIDVAAGETLQTLSCKQWDISEADYLRMIRGKTAALCRVACELGAELAGAGETITRQMADYGESLGMAFQVADDVLDLWGSSQETGKTLGTDLLQGKATLPVLYLLRGLNSAERQQVLRILEECPEERWERIRPYLQRSGAREQAIEFADHLARQALDGLRALPSSAARDTLTHLCQSVVHRYR